MDANDGIVNLKPWIPNSQLINFRKDRDGFYLHDASYDHNSTTKQTLRSSNGPHQTDTKNI